MNQLDHNIGVSDAQYDFISAEEEYTLFCGGLGSGKTHAGALWAMLMCLKYPKTRGLITANSYSQLKKATLVKFFEILEMYGVPYEYKIQDGVILVGHHRAVVYALSMEKYDLLRGIEFGWAWGDECAFYKAEAFDVMIGRIRDTKGPCQWKGTTTPNGFNWLYTKFVETPPESSTVVYSKTSDNAANLAKSYIRNLRGQYDSKLSQQELDGQFVNLTSGKVFYKFDRNQHVREVHDIGDYLFIGLDFNVDPLCGVYCYTDGRAVYIFDELYQKDSNTFKASKTITQQFPNRYITVASDETGNRRKTSSQNTDHEILRRAGFNVVNFKNPKIKDRNNNVNRLLEQNLIFIDPRCKYLIKELEQYTYESDDEAMGHITDALGYIAWHLFPFKKPKRNVSVQYK